MHEFAICQGIVKAALDEMSKVKPAPRALLKVRVVIGKLHQIVSESLLLAYEVLIRDTPAAGSQLEIEHVPITAQCKSCGWKGEIQQPYFMCGACNSGEIELITGKELYLANLEIEQNDS
jgi:hydrogenase nickel incorporation protein HypA/HybF